MSDLDWAKFMLKFLKAKHNQGLQKNCKCVKKLAKLGITDWE